MCAACFLHLQRGGGGEVAVAHDSREEHVAHEDYVQMCMLVYRAMLAEYNEADARASAEGDWLLALPRAQVRAW